MNVKICLLDGTVYEFSEDDVKTITFIKNDMDTPIPEGESASIAVEQVVEQAEEEPAVFEEKPIPVPEPKVVVVPTPIIEKMPVPVPEPKIEEVPAEKPDETPTISELESRRSQFLERMMRLNRAKSESKTEEVPAEKSNVEKNNMINLAKISKEEREAILRILNPPADTSNDVSFKEY